MKTSCNVMERCERFLISSLKCLPEVELCCFCDKNLKLASIPCAILIFLVVFPHNRIAFLFYAVDYHHKLQPLPIIQAILACSGIVLCITTIMTNIVVFFMFCKENIPKTWGYLFVLFFITLMVVESAWCVLAFIRSFYDPGLFCQEIEVIEEMLYHSKNKLYCNDIFVFAYLALYILLFYPLIVIYSWLRVPPYVPEDDISLASSGASSYASGYSSRSNSRAASVSSYGVSKKTSKRSLIGDLNDERKNIIINQNPQEKANQEAIIVFYNEISFKHTENMCSEPNDKENEDTIVHDNATLPD